MNVTATMIVEFLGALAGGAALGTFCINVIMRLMSIQKAMDEKLSKADHDIICKDRDDSIKESLKKIEGSLDGLVRKDALDNISQMLNKHIESRAIVDDRQDLFRTDIKSSVGALTTQVAVMQNTIDITQKIAIGKGV